MGWIQDAYQKKKRNYKRICYQIINTKGIISSKKRGLFQLNGSLVQNLRIWILPQYSANARFLSYKDILCWQELSFQLSEDGGVDLCASLLD